MGWAVGQNSNGRWVGYGVPATCDHPGCGASIDRGLGFACDGNDADLDGEWPHEDGCGRYFCGKHGAGGTCARCAAGEEPFPETPDTLEWAAHVTADDSWAQWREDHPGWAAQYAAQMAAAAENAGGATEQERRAVAVGTLRIAADELRGFGHDAAAAILDQSALDMERAAQKS
jgi:hypothetical protein